MQENHPNTVANFVSTSRPKSHTTGSNDASKQVPHLPVNPKSPASRGIHSTESAASSGAPRPLLTDRMQRMKRKTGQRHENSGESSNTHPKTTSNHFLDIPYPSFLAGQSWNAVSPSSDSAMAHPLSPRASSETYTPSPSFVPAPITSASEAGYPAAASSSSWLPSSTIAGLVAQARAKAAETHSGQQKSRPGQRWKSRHSYQNEGKGLQPRPTRGRNSVPVQSEVHDLISATSGGDGDDDRTEYDEETDEDRFMSAASEDAHDEVDGTVTSGSSSRSDSTDDDDVDRVRNMDSMRSNTSTPSSASASDVFSTDRSTDREYNTLAAQSFSPIYAATTQTKVKKKLHESLNLPDTRRNDLTAPVPEEREVQPKASVESGAPGIPASKSPDFAGYLRQNLAPTSVVPNSSGVGSSEVAAKTEPTKDQEAAKVATSSEQPVRSSTHDISSSDRAAPSSPRRTSSPSRKSPASPRAASSPSRKSPASPRAASSPNRKSPASPRTPSSPNRKSPASPRAPISPSRKSPGSPLSSIRKSCSSSLVHNLKEEIGTNTKPGHPRYHHLHHPRVPGGAAAKLMLMGPKKDQESDDESGDDAQEGGDVAAEMDVSDISRSLELSKTEFSMGSLQNRRYRNDVTDKTVVTDDGAGSLKAWSSEDHKNNLGTETGLSSASSMLFSRSHVFHATASAAVASLLNPRKMYGSDVMSTASSGHNNSTMISTLGGCNDATSVVSGRNDSVMSSFSPPTGGALTSLASLANPTRKADVSPRLLSRDSERKVERLKEDMVDPSPRIAALLEAIHSPDTNPMSDSDDGSHDAPLFEADLGFTVRRKNACGALQILTAQPNQRVRICWTVGVLPALTSVLRDTGYEGLHIRFPERRHRVEFEAARNRAISCLMNLSIPAKNRIPICHSPDLVHWLIVILNEPHGQARKGVSSILAHLGKSVENRLVLTQIPGLLDAAQRILLPLPPRMERISRKTKQTTESDDEDEDKFESNRDVVTTQASCSDQSSETARLAGSHSPIEISGYDETADENLRGARQNVFALLMHLSKEKDNAYHLARSGPLMTCLADVSKYQQSSSHLLALQVLSNVSRHRLNGKTLVFKQRSVVPALVNALHLEHDESRLCACRAIQNFAQDKSCRQELAICPGLLSSLCERARKSTNQPEERLSALSALKNLCDEPANLIPMTNTPDCIATLMHLAHGMEEGITETMQYRACDALATLSHWLRKIATSGQALENQKLGVPPPRSLFVPSLQVVTFDQWQ